MSSVPQGCSVTGQGPEYPLQPPLKGQGTILTELKVKLETTHWPPRSVLSSGSPTLSSQLNPRLLQMSVLQLCLHPSLSSFTFLALRFKNFYWRVVDLQCCSFEVQSIVNPSSIHMCPLLFRFLSPQAITSTEQSPQCFMVGPCLSSILYTEVHMCSCCILKIEQLLAL